MLSHGVARKPARCHTFMLWSDFSLTEFLCNRIHRYAPAHKKNRAIPGRGLLWCVVLLLQLHGGEGLMLQGVAIMPLHAVLVLEDLPVELVDEEIDGRIEIFMV